VDRKGHVIAIGRTADDAISAADRAIGAIEIVYAPEVARIVATGQEEAESVHRGAA
jgi:hypothetical protein